MLRGQDRAMRNIESMPGGYNALTRMYNEIAEPLQEAAATPRGRVGVGGVSATTSASTTSPSEVKAMPNPWKRGNAAAPASSAAAAQRAAHTFLPAAAGGGAPWLGGLRFPSAPSRLMPGVPAPANPWSGLGAAAAEAAPAAAAPNPWANPEATPETFASQLATLHELGFSDDERNMVVLLQVKGNVNLAISELLD